MEKRAKAEAKRERRRQQKEAANAPEAHDIELEDVDEDARTDSN